MPVETDKINSNGKAKKLSPEQEKILDSLVDPDDPKNARFEWGDDFQRRVLAGFLVDADFMAKGRSLVEPHYFSNEAHTLISTIAFSHWDNSRSLPSEDILANEMAIVTKEKDDAIKLLYRAELSTVLNYFVPGLADRQYWYKQILNFAVRQSLVLAFDKARTESTKATGAMPTLLAVRAELDRVARLCLPNADKLLRWNDLRKLAEEQQEDWLVDKFLESSCVTVFSGLPYAGKTTVVTEMIAAIAQKKPLFGRACKRCPILFINADKTRERIVVARISRGLKDDQAHADLQEIFFMPDIQDMPSPITDLYIETLIEKITSMMEGMGGIGVVVIDTLRTAFLSGSEAGAENDSAEIVKFLAPLKTLARKSKWAVLLLHHNSRARNDYAGSAAIAGATDSMWNIWRDENSDNLATLRIKTREGQLPDLRLRETPTGIITVDEATAQADAKKLADIEAEAELVTFINLFPVTEPEALTFAAVEAMEWVTGMGWKGKTLRRRIEDAEREGISPRLESVGLGTKSDPTRWYRT